MLLCSRENGAYLCAAWSYWTTGSWCSWAWPSWPGQSLPGLQGAASAPCQTAPPSAGHKPFNVSMAHLTSSCRKTKEGKQTEKLQQTTELKVLTSSSTKTSLYVIKVMWRADLHTVVAVGDVWRHSWCCHVGATNSLDLCDTAKLNLIQQLRGAEVNGHLDGVIQQWSPSYDSEEIFFSLKHAQRTETRDQGGWGAAEAYVSPNGSQAANFCAGWVWAPTPWSAASLVQLKLKCFSRRVNSLCKWEYC